MIIHGDCLRALKSIGNVDCIITDPPYFVIPKGKKTTKGVANFKWDNFNTLDDFCSFTKE